jgi:hypothetical protein
MIRIIVLAGMIGGFYLNDAKAMHLTPATMDAFARQLNVNTPTDMRAFRKCMRAQYGPRYFRGVRKQYQLIMAQACM